MFSAARQRRWHIHRVCRSSQSYPKVNTYVWQHSGLWHRWRPYFITCFARVFDFWTHFSSAFITPWIFSLDFGNRPTGRYKLPYCCRFSVNKIIYISCICDWWTLQCDCRLCKYYIIIAVVFFIYFSQLQFSCNNLVIFYCKLLSPLLLSFLLAFLLLLLSLT